MPKGRHGFTKNGKRCLLFAPESLDGLQHYCANHLPKTRENPLLERFENLVLSDANSSSSTQNQGSFSSGKFESCNEYIK